MQTRVTWWIRDGHAALEGSDLVPGQVSKPEAEVMLDHATAKVEWDLRSLPHFCDSFYSCEDPEDWKVVRVEETR